MFRFAATLAVILVALALVGCGSGHDQGGPATLSIMGFGSGDEIARARVAIAKRAIATARVDNPNGDSACSSSSRQWQEEASRI